jgi:hypothetical protein
LSGHCRDRANDGKGEYAKTQYTLAHPVGEY